MLMYSRFRDKNVKVMRIIFTIILIGTIILWSLTSFAMNYRLHAYAEEMRQEIDLMPPQIGSVNIVPSDEKLNFSYLVSDAEHGGSQIIVTDVLLFRTRVKEGEIITPCYSIVIQDPISGLKYGINIPLENVDGVEGTADDDGLVDVLQTDGVGKKLFRPERPYVEGTITGYFDFQGSVIYTDCRYYMIIIALDYYGNAYWEIYDVTEHVHMLAGKQMFERRIIGGPKIWTHNIDGKVERGGIISHYYTLDGNAYIPWIKIGGGELQKCFVLNIVTGGSIVKIRELKVEIRSQAIAGGVFILRCYELWKYGTLTISVDGTEYWRIIFGYTIGLYGLFALLIFIQVMMFVLLKGKSRR